MACFPSGLKCVIGWLMVIISKCADYYLFNIIYNNCYNLVLFLSWVVALYPKPCHKALLLYIPMILPNTWNNIYMISKSAYTL